MGTTVPDPTSDSVTLDVLQANVQLLAEREQLELEKIGRASCRERV